VATFIVAATPREIVFTRQPQRGRSTWWARSWGDENIRARHEILLTGWRPSQSVCPGSWLAAVPVRLLRHAGLTETDELDLEDFKPKNQQTEPGLCERCSISNTWVASIRSRRSQAQHDAGALLLVDALAKRACRILPVERDGLGLDFFGVGAPTSSADPPRHGASSGGGRPARGDAAVPGWGEMIQDVYLEEHSWADCPNRSGTRRSVRAVGDGSGPGLPQRHSARSAFHRWEADTPPAGCSERLAGD